MSLESATTISELNSSNPTGNDKVSEGDDHLRLIKSCLKSQFQSSDGNGLSEAVVATAADMNALGGWDSTFPDHTIAELMFILALSGVNQAGNGLVFYQKNAPTGWTQITDQNDFALQVVSGDGGDWYGGAAPFNINITGNNSASGISIDQMPAHGHFTFREGKGTSPLDPPGGTRKYPYAQGQIGTGGDDDYIITGNTGLNSSNASGETTQEGGGQVHNHIFTSSQYDSRRMTVIICRKDG